MISAATVARQSRRFDRQHGAHASLADCSQQARHPNDRLLLGMKGTMSELELSLFRQRSQQALKQKASRGALILALPPDT